MTDKRKDLPAPGTANFEARIREELMRFLGRQGDRMDRALTVRDLIGTGLARLNPRWKAGQDVPPVLPPGRPPVDNSPPPTPTGFTLTGGITYVVVEHDEPLYTNSGGHARTLLFGVMVEEGKPLPTFSDAQPLADFAGMVYAYPTSPATSWRMWIKWQSAGGLESQPAGGIYGLEVRTGEDVRRLLDAITQAAQDPNSPYSKFAVRADLFYVASEAGPVDASLFSVVTHPMEVNGVKVPVGAYMADAFIMNGTITNAKIANLAVDDAKVANLSAAKLTAGEIKVGEFIQSTGFRSGENGVGWRIDGRGNIEASNGIFRGAVYATSGTLGGIRIDENGIRSGNYDARGSGFWLGADGTLHLPRGSVEAYALNVTSLEAVSAMLGNVHSGSIRGGAFEGYVWPQAHQGGGFYLGPQGLLLGNANTGRYFQITADGDLYSPKMNIVNGVMSISQINLIDTNHMVIGSVSFGIDGQGNNLVSLPLHVPEGTICNVLLAANFGQTNVLPKFEGQQARTVSLTGAPRSETQEAQEGYWFWPWPINGWRIEATSLVSVLRLGPGNYNLEARAQYTLWDSGFNTPISMIGIVFKR